MCTTDCNTSEHVPLINPVPIHLNASMAITQVFVWPLIYVNILMLFAFSKKEAFRKESRYILFAHTLMVDLIFLILTDFVVILSYTYVLLPVAFCIPLCMLMETVTACTPLTITAMCIERYVAICLPLRHGTISTVGRTLFAILIIWLTSFIKPFMDMFILTTTASQEYLAELTICHYDIMMLEDWHRLMSGVLYIVNFVFVLFAELFCYVMIGLAARAASVNKKLAVKGRSTISMHIVQLTLCNIEIISPYIEALVIHDLNMYFPLRFFNFIMFNVVARAVSPLVYGFRDERFRAHIMYYARCKQNNVSFESREPNT